MKIQHLIVPILATILLYILFSFKYFIQKPETDLKLGGTSNISFERINPDLLIYPFKRIYEKIRLKLIPDPQMKASYQCLILEKRFKELLYIALSEKTSFLPLVNQRYANSYTTYKKTYPTSQCSSLNRDNRKILESLRDNYPANSAYWLIFQQTLDATKK